MIFKRYDWDIPVRVLLLLLTLTIAAYLLVRKDFLYFALVVPVIVYQVIIFYQLQRKISEELEQFAESIRYRDFSRHFDVKHSSAIFRSVRKGFNDINATFKLISKEKETQYQYLQKILELVDTGILSYEMETGEVIWMNESLKRILQLPYLKTIHSFEKRDGELYGEIIGLQPGIGKVAIARSGNTYFRILLSATAFQTGGKKYKLIAFQNVSEALDETESRAWQKLLSVMTHEIMNSVAPISSLADTLKNRLQQTRNGLNDQSVILEDLELGIDTIKKRSDGLLKFAEIYRNLNKIVKPNLKRILVRDLFENLNRLMEPTLEQKGIELEIILKDPALFLEADTDLIEQVLINLLVNAIEAVKDKHDPHIMLSAHLSINQKAVIEVADNGKGISPTILDKIFIPFFSTKKNGSGIGLSLCQQIMMLHHGHIQARSEEGKQTFFVLQF